MDFRAALLDQTRAFGELIRSADPSTPVPTCPDWTLKQLFRHVGRGNRWAAQIIADRRDETIDPRDVRDGKPPDDPDAAIDWLNSGAQLIIDAVDRVGAETRVWTFIGPRPCGWWIRRRAARSHGAPRRRGNRARRGLSSCRPSWPPTGSTSGSSASAVEARRQSSPLERGGRCTCMPPTTASDPPGSGRSPATRRTASRGRTTHGKGDVALRGTAKDLLLAIVRRRTAADGGIEVFGDTAVWDGWLDRTPF